MELHQLPKITENRLKRVGRGHGSGRGKTSGRGTKGQKARRSIPLHFEGGALPLTKRLPFLKGKGRNKAISKKFVTIKLESLNVFPPKSVVDIQALLKNNIIDSGEAKKGVKILGTGNIEHAITVNLPVTSSAKEKIEKAGGTVEVA